ncbi:MAG: hypothetical protein LBV26_00935 [Bacteroidales bacterium]|jgi:hypothetical protein|nr:hypothetical protein [Bacteroidales bacterium]
MFHFGSLFAQLPLLIIGTLYVLYLGLNAVNRGKTGQVEEKTGQHNVQVTETGGSHGNCVDYFTLANALDSFTDNHKTHLINAPCRLAEDIIFHDRDFPVISFYCISILSRPPPEA